jgi:protein-tyrosine kinase
MTEPINFWAALRRSWRLLLALTVVGAIVAVVIPVGSSAAKTSSSSSKLKWQSAAVVGAVPYGGIGGTGVTTSTILLWANNFYVKISAINDAGMGSDSLALAAQMTGAAISYAQLEAGPKSVATTTTGAGAKAPTTSSNNGLVQLNASAPTAALAIKLTDAYAKAVENGVNNAFNAHQQSQQKSQQASQPTTSGFTILLPALNRNTFRTTSTTPSQLASKKVRLLLGAVLGLVVAALLVLVRELFDKRMHQTSQVENHYKYPVVAEIPKPADSTAARQVLEVVDDPGSPTAETYRKLRMSILFERLHVGGSSSSALGDPFTAAALGIPVAAAEPYASPEPGSRQVVLVVSAVAEESRPVVVANLCATYAEAGQRVIVVTTNDLDSGARSGDQRNLTGPVTAVDIQSQLRPSNLEEVSTLSLRPFVRTSGRLVTRAKVVLDAARELADVIIVEAPPLIDFHHGEALLHAVDVVLVVAECRTTTTEDADEAGSILRKLGAPVLGVVFTNLPVSRQEARRRARLAECMVAVDEHDVDGPTEPSRPVPQTVPDGYNGQPAGSQVSLPT